MRGKYVRDTLSQGELILFETNFHWITLVPNFLWCLILGVILSFLPHEFYSGGVAIIIAAIVCFPFFRFLSHIISYFTSEFSVTNKRVVVKIGWLRTRTIEMNINKVESILVDQSLTGRFFLYGTITIIGSGGTREPFPKISFPIEFRSAILRLQLST